MGIGNLGFGKMDSANWETAKWDSAIWDVTSQTVNLFIQLRYKDVYVFIKSRPPISRKIQNLALRYMGGTGSPEVFFSYSWAS